MPAPPPGFTVSMHPTRGAIAWHPGTQHDLRADGRYRDRYIGPSFDGERSIAICEDDFSWCSFDESWFWLTPIPGYDKPDTNTRLTHLEGALADFFYQIDTPNREPHDLDTAIDTLRSIRDDRGRCVGRGSTPPATPSPPSLQGGSSAAGSKHR